MRLPVYVVREKNEGEVKVLSAWSDVYAAKYEAARWEQDSKIEHDYIEGVLEIEDKSYGSEASEVV